MTSMFCRAAAFVAAAALVLIAGDVAAKPVKMCFKTANGKNFISVGNGGYLDARARACSGNAVFSVDYFIERTARPPLVGPPVVIKAANGRYVQFWGRALRTTQNRIARNDRRFMFSFRAGLSNVRGARPLADGMRLTLFPMQSRYYLMTMAERNGGGRLMNNRRTSPRNPAANFTIAFPGGAKTAAKPKPKPKPQARKWVPYGGEYEAPTFTKEGNIVTVTGLIKGGSGPHLWTVPKGLAPKQRLIFNLNNHGKSARIDILPDGRMVWVAGGRDHGWLSLSGIKYSLKPSGKLRLASGWRPYGGEYAPPTFTRQGNLITVSGLIKGGKHGHLATLPKGLAPPKTLIFNLNNHERSARIDVTNKGQIIWVADGRGHGWLSLAGISFYVKPQARPKLAAGWQPYGGTFQAPSVSRQGNVVTVGGLIRGGKFGHLATLPKGFQPTKRVIYSVNNHHNQARVDVLPDGRVLWVAGAKDHGWMSLAGIDFKTAQPAPKRAAPPPAAFRPDHDWAKMPGKAIDVGAGADGMLWVVGTNKLAYQWVQGKWVKRPGTPPLRRIDVRNRDEVWAVAENMQIWRAAKGKWQQMPSFARDIGVAADGAVVAIGPDRHPYRWSGSGWKRVPGSGQVAVDVGPKGTYWIVNGKGEIWFWDGKAWKAEKGPKARDVSVGPRGRVFIVGADGKGYTRTGANAWKVNPKSGGQMAVAALPRGPVIVNGGNDIWRFK